MIANTRTAEIRFAPPVNWCVSESLNNASSSLYINGFKIIIPKSPYITEGIPASSSTAGFTTAASLLGAASAKNTAVRIPIGTPISTAINVPTTEVRIT